MSTETDGKQSDGNTCFVCGANMGDRWFGRVNQVNWKISLCSPRCGILYLEAPLPQSGLADRTQYYRDQDQLIKAAKAVTGELYSFDARMGNSAY